MNNIFKQNSRFGALAEEASTTREPKKNNNNNNNNNNKNKINEDRFKIEENNTFKNVNNSFKKSFNDRPQMNYNNGYQRNSMTNRESKETIERRALDVKLRKEEHAKIESVRLAKALCIDNFPTLGKKTNTNETNNNNNFLAKLKNSIENDKKQNEIIIQENITKPKPGWATISREPLTGRTKLEYDKPPLNKKSENEIAYDVLSALCDLHERRTKEYIDLYGYDNWERTFKSPILEILDDEYEYVAQMAEDDDEYEDDTTENDRYWERY